MKIKIEIVNRKSFITANSKQIEMRTTWLKKLTMNDFLLEVERLTK